MTEDKPNSAGPDTQNSAQSSGENSPPGSKVVSLLTGLALIGLMAWVGFTPMSAFIKQIFLHPDDATTSLIVTNGNHGSPARTEAQQTIFNRYTKEPIYRTILAPDFNTAVELAIREKVSLHNADLSNRSLIRISLRSADLSGADFSNSDLTEAMLDKADLREANLESSNLTQTSLTGANLTGANLKNAVITEDQQMPNNERVDQNAAGHMEIRDH